MRVLISACRYHPVANDLKHFAANPGCIRIRVAFVDRRQSETTQVQAVEVDAKGGGRRIDKRSFAKMTQISRDLKTLNKPELLLIIKFELSIELVTIFYLI